MLTSCRTCSEVQGVGSSLRTSPLLVPCECGGSERPSCPNAVLRVGLDGLRGSSLTVTQSRHSWRDQRKLPGLAWRLTCRRWKPTRRFGVEVMVLFRPPASSPNMVAFTEARTITIRLAGCPRDPVFVDGRLCVSGFEGVRGLNLRAWLTAHNCRAQQSQCWTSKRELGATLAVQRHICTVSEPSQLQCPDTTITTQAAGRKLLDVLTRSVSAC